MKSRTLGNADMPFSALKYPLLVSIKYDGRRTQVDVKNGKVTFKSSGSKVFTLENPEPFNKLPDGVYFAEMMGENVKGRLGDRVHSGIQTTMFTNTKKGIKNHHKPTWKIFYYLTWDEYDSGKGITKFSDMISTLNGFARLAGVEDSVVEFKWIMTHEALIRYYKSIISNGWEGLMCAVHDIKWSNSSSRRKDYVKLKESPTLKAVVTGTSKGAIGTKYESMIGSLECTYKGKNFKVGSGLSDSDRLKDESYFIGKTIKISYEQLIDDVPQQPRYEYIDE